MDRPYYMLSAQEVVDLFETSNQGLSSNEVEARREEYGLNRLEDGKGVSLWSLFFSQLLNPLVILLFFAAGLKLFLGSYIEGGTIGATVLLMIGLAFFQEAKAEHSLQALKELAPKMSRVMREGSVLEVLSEELVPGDLLVLESGDKISADARVISQSRFQVSEASLTGESTPISKGLEPIAGEAGIGDRINMVHTSSTVLTGKAKAVVTAIGAKTELGKIAGELGKGEKENTPLQRGIDKLSRGMLILVGLIVVVLVVMGIATGLSWIDITLFSVAVAVAAIPEGLPAVVTVVLSIGVRLMAQKKALVRKLLAVETLGSISVICCDKTGTLTLNELTVTDHESVGDPSQLLRVATLCQDAHRSGGRWVGDPADVAILRWAEERGGEMDQLMERYPRLADIPFASENGLMGTLNRGEDGNFVCVKGAPERVIGACQLEEEEKKELFQKVEEMSGKGLKVLAAAKKEFSGEQIEHEDLLHGLTFCGFFGLIDPPREDASAAIKKCQDAGIHVAMVTGDHPLTARAIGEALGLDGQEVITGQELEHLEEDELVQRAQKTSIFARIEPLQKLRLVRAFKSLGHTVAMTGDGVNDSPALEAADIGVAMGKGGTDVAKEASEMVLLDDRFATIVDAVEEGRVLFARLRHSTTFLLATCLGEVFVILLSILTVGIAPLEPLQILWINLVTGSLLAIPLGTEPKIGDELTYPPRDPDVGLIYPGMVWRIGALSFCLGLGAFSVFLDENPFEELSRARSAAFATVILFEWLVALQIRSDEKPLWKLGLFKNRNLFLALGGALLFFLAILYIPFFQAAFHTRGLTLYEWGVCALPGLVVFFLEELRKTLSPRLFSYGKWKKKSY